MTDKNIRQVGSDWIFWIPSLFNNCLERSVNPTADIFMTQNQAYKIDTKKLESVI